MTKYMTLRQCAEFLGVSTTTMYRYVKHTDIPFRMLGTRYRFNVQQIEEWLERQNHAHSFGE